MNCVCRRILPTLIGFMKNIDVVAPSELAIRFLLKLLISQSYKYI
jgi:hypothetical protein